MEAPEQIPRDGALIVDSKIRGRVCIARFSFSLKEVIGMALVDDELAQYDTRLDIYEDGCGGRLIHGKVVPMPFYDPEGMRMRM